MRVWAAHEVGLHVDGPKTIVHPELGEITVECQILTTENRARSLLVFTPMPDSADHDKLVLLSAVGQQQFTG